MDTTIRNLDEHAYRAIRARAVLEGRTVGDMISEAIRDYISRPAPTARRGSLRDLLPEPFPPGNKHLSSEIDEIVYGVRR